MADLYVAVLRAIARLRPGVATIGYEELRSSLREVLKGPLPQAHETSRVLKHMTGISKDDKAAPSVIDFDEKERELHITDPFFAFFLKWGTIQ